MRNRESKNGQPHNVDDHADEVTRSCRHLGQSVVQHIVKHVRCAGEKVTCEVLLSTVPVTNGEGKGQERSRQVTERLQKGYRKVTERLQKGYRKVTERLQKGYRKVTERLQKGYRKVTERLQKG